MDNLIAFVFGGIMGLVGGLILSCIIIVLHEEDDVL